MSIRDFFITNSWWGKILGALFGYMIDGPIGSLFGILLGNFFDRGLATHFSNPHFSYHAERRKTVQKIYFEATFSVMGHLAKSDGHISKREIEMAKQLMAEMHLNHEQKELARHFFSEGKQIHFKLDNTLASLYKDCRDNRELLKLFVEIQYKAALVDGLTPKKINTLDHILTQLGFAPLSQQHRFFEDFNYTAYHHFQEYQKRHQQYQQGNQGSSSGSHYYKDYNPNSNINPVNHAYTLLEITPNSSKQEVKKAYRRLLSQNHPDKLIAQGLPEEMIKLANDKTQKIVKAYELICKSKGW